MIFDHLSILYIAYLSLLGLLIFLFSRKHLAMNHFQSKFNTLLIVTLIAASFLSMSENLAALSAIWIICGVCLRFLLALVGDTEARLQAKRFMWVDLLSNTSFVIAAIVWPYHQTIALVLLLHAVIIRLALPPYDGWLSHSLAAPSPVSALMHAGLVNGGLLILCRFAQPLWQQALLMTALFVLSCFTIVYIG